MERRIEESGATEPEDRDDQRLSTTRTDAGDDLTVIQTEGELAVIRDLQPERTAEAEEALAEGEALIDGVVPEVIEAPETDETVEVEEVGDLRVEPDGATQIRHRMLVAGHVASDIFCLNLVLFATSLLDTIELTSGPNEAGWLLALGGSVAWIAIFHAFGLYATRHFNSSEEIRRVVGASSVGAALLMILGAGGISVTTRTQLGLAFVLLVALEVVTRILWRRYARSLRAKGLLAYRTLIVGSAGDAAFVASSLGEDDRSGFFPVGRIAIDPGTDDADAPPFLGTLGEASRVVEEQSIEALIVASPTLTTTELGRLQRLARREGLALRLVARVPNMLTNRFTLQRVGPLMTVAVRQARLTGTQAAMKRASDITIAGIGLVISLPIQLIVGLLVALTSPGPVLFRQDRVTRGNKRFTVYKFRTMDRDADKIMDEREIDRTKPFFKGGEEPPVTPVGRVLRKLSLDELPQLWNVVRGDMSLVGPRPLTAEQVHANPEMLGPRHEVRAGLTGWWQVNGRSDVSAEEAIKQDLFYIENWSLLLDLYIMLRTVWVVLGRKGAR